MNTRDEQTVDVECLVCGFTVACSEEQANLYLHDDIGTFALAICARCRKLEPKERRAVVMRRLGRDVEAYRDKGVLRLRQRTE